MVPYLKLCTELVCKDWRTEWDIPVDD